MSSARRNFLLILTSKIIGFVTSIVATPIIVRILGPDKYGQYAVVLSMVTVLMILTNMGMFNGIRKHIGDHKGGPEELKDIFNLYTQMSVILAFIVSSLIILGTYLGFIRQIFGSGFDTYFYLASTMISVRQLFRLARGALIGLDQTNYSESIQIAKRILFPVLAIILAINFDEVIGILLADILAIGLTALVGLAFVTRIIPTFNILSISSPTISGVSILKFNISSVMLVTLVVSLYHADILLLQFFGFKNKTGIYKSALVIAEFLWFVPTAIQTSILHSVSELWANDQIARVSKMASQVTRHVVTFSLLLVIGVAVLAEPLIHVYFGSDFSAAVTPLLILLPGAFGFAVVRPIYTIGQSTGDLRPLIILTGVTATTNLVLNVVLIPRYGINGAGIATSIGYGSMLVLHIIGAKWIGFNPIRQIYPVRLLVTGGGTVVPLYLIADSLSRDVVSLLVVPPIGFFIYTGIAISVGLVTNEEIKTIKHEVQAKLKELA